MSEEAEASLDERLCLVLYRTSHAMSAAYRELLRPLDLTYPQYTVMSALWRSEPSTVKSLGELLDAGYGTMSPLVHRLEDKGLVRRARGSGDEREVLVGLTESGRELGKRAAHVQSRIRHATGLTDTEQRQLVETLQRLGDRLAGAGQA